VLDLKRAEAREVAERLAAQSDVLISNVRPQALARLGLDFESLRALNPRLIHVSCCGYRPGRAVRGQPAYDDLIQGATAIPTLVSQYGADLPCYAPARWPTASSACSGVCRVGRLYEREKHRQGAVGGRADVRGDDAVRPG
jgi:crotonobetainyl-CoA:carnitine CoA-transferase CaiB-like acyl-CoA transferase